MNKSDQTCAICNEIFASQKGLNIHIARNKHCDTGYQRKFGGFITNDASTETNSKQVDNCSFILSDTAIDSCLESDSNVARLPLRRSPSPDSSLVVDGEKGSSKRTKYNSCTVLHQTSLNGNSIHVSKTDFDPKNCTNDADDVEYASTANEYPCNLSDQPSEAIGSLSVPSNALIPYNRIMMETNTDELGIPLFSREDYIRSELISILNRNRAHLTAYKEVMDWAQQATLDNYPFLSPYNPSRANVIDELRARTGTFGLIPEVRHLRLPCSRKIVRITFFKAPAVLSSLLTSYDLNKDDNYLFHNDDPFADPLRNSEMPLGDINTGRCYLQSYRTLCKGENDVLLLIPIAIDKTHCDSKGRLVMEPINVSLGIHKRHIRQLSKANRPLGYISHDPILSDVDPSVKVFEFDPLPYASFIRNKSVSKAALNCNNYHAQILFIFKESGFLDLQDRGFRWSLPYKGEVHNVIFRIVVPFIVGDTEGHDYICGKFSAVQSQKSYNPSFLLCRQCECPFNQSDISGSKFRFRYSYRVKNLITKGSVQQLKDDGLWPVVNAFDHIRFGFHNKRGLFGACPGEILHMLQLGLFQFVIVSYYQQIGPSSNECDEVEKIFRYVGNNLQHQSDRDLPRTYFSNGFHDGKIYAGMRFRVVCLLCCSPCTLHVIMTSLLIDQSGRRKED